MLKTVTNQVSSDQLPAGTVLQVVNATLATAGSTTSTSFVDTGLTATITPKKASSKILVTAHLSGIFNQTQGQFLLAQLLRDATAIGEIAGATGYSQSGGQSGGGAASISYLDSPSTTSATTYKLQARVSGGASFWSNNNSISSITLMEVAQ